MPLVDITKYFGWLDFCGVLFYMMFVAWYHFKFIPKAAKQDDAQNITCADFAVEISHLPSHIPGQESFTAFEYEDSLAQHLLGVIQEARRKDSHVKTQSEAKVAEVA